MGAFGERLCSEKLGFMVCTYEVCKLINYLPSLRRLLAVGHTSMQISSKKSLASVLTRRMKWIVLLVELISYLRCDPNTKYKFWYVQLIFSP